MRHRRDDHSLARIRVDSASILPSFLEGEPWGDTDAYGINLTPTVIFFPFFPRPGFLPGIGNPLGPGIAFTSESPGTPT